jgi:hypothetical protein
VGTLLALYSSIPFMSVNLKNNVLLTVHKLVMVAHTCILSIPETEAGRSRI